MSVLTSIRQIEPYAKPFMHRLLPCAVAGAAGAESETMLDVSCNGPGWVVPGLLLPVDDNTMCAAM